jgi:hypothetical protein
MNSIPNPPALFGIGFPSAGEITVSGAVAWLERLFFLPGDWLLWALAAHAPHAASFLKLSSAHYGGAFAGIVSAMAWIAAFVIVGTIYSAVRDLDRALTQRLANLYGDARARLRVAARLVVYRLRKVAGKTEQRRRQEPVLELSEHADLAAEELKILHAHLGLTPGFALPVSDVAVVLRARKADAERVLAKLARLDLLRSTIGGLDGESAYTLTPAGRAFLAFRRAAAGRKDPPLRWTTVSSEVNVSRFDASGSSGSTFHGHITSRSVVEGRPRQREAGQRGGKAAS